MTSLRATRYLAELIGKREACSGREPFCSSGYCDPDITDYAVTGELAAEPSEMLSDRDRIGVDCPRSRS